MSRNELTLEHFERWLEGQVAFGIDLTKPTRFYDNYLAQHSTMNPCDRMRRMAERTPREVTAPVLKMAIERWKEMAA